MPPTDHDHSACCAEIVRHLELQQSTDFLELRHSATMGGFDFEWKGKTYEVDTEGGYPCPDSDEVAEALEQWRKSPEGIKFFGPLPTDWSKEHW